MSLSPRILTLAFAVATLAIPLLPVPDFWVTLLIYIALAALVALGLVLLTGVGGMTSFGQAAFVGFGAYTTAVLCLDYGWSPWATLPVALIVTGVSALLIGAMTVRLSGHYLPLGTLCWGIAFFYLFGNIPLLGAHDGLSGIPSVSVFGLELSTPRSFYPLVWVAVALSILATMNLLDSRIGRAIRALRRGRTAAEAFGVNTPRAKLVVFVYAALLAGLSGWLYAHFQRAVSPSAFGPNAGIEYLLMAVVGGSGHVWGALLGATLVTVLKDWLQDFLPLVFGSGGNFETVVFGVLLIGILQTAREGLWPHLAKFFPVKSAETRPAEAAELPARPLPEKGAPLLEVEHARKTFGGLVAVNDVSFEVRAGEIIGLIGPNGAGKSTTFNLVTGVAHLTSGTVRFAGQVISGLPSRTICKLGMARTFQHVKLVPDMSVLENVALGAHPRGHMGVRHALIRLDRAEEARIMAEAARQIERVGLGALMHRPAGSLALGQLRIVEIARALCLDPSLLLLDEPAAGLRHKEKQALADLLVKLRAEGMSVLIVEHDMDFLMGITDRLVVLDFGTRIATGTPAEIRVNPAVLEAYLGGAAA